ncbi:hypothetical protein [Sphingomonas antarctica]|uniref:hypothetical protein n=1 Tax=Sphingomonas antarctica TaxID=2040274 RepID=UPI0039EAEBE3
MRWRRLFDERAEVDAVEDRVLRRICELRPDAGYIPALKAQRAERFAEKVAKASNDAVVLAPWLDQEAA